MVKKEVKVKKKDVVSSDRTNNGEQMIQEELQKLDQKLESLSKELRLFAKDGDIKESYDVAILRETIDILQRKKNSKQEQLDALKNKKKANTTPNISYVVLETGEKKTMQITEWWNSNPEERRISRDSPLGSTLVNTDEGEIGIVHLKKGNYQVKVISKSYS